MTITLGLLTAVIAYILSSIIPIHTIIYHRKELFNTPLCKSRFSRIYTEIWIILTLIAFFFFSIYIYSLIPWGKVIITF
jgi:hypothetical protein